MRDIIIKAFVVIAIICIIVGILAILSYITTEEVFYKIMTGFSVSITFSILTSIAFDELRNKRIIK